MLLPARPLPRRARRGRRARRARVRRSGASSDYLRVPLKLVTGPANAAKAGEVLGGLRARLDDDPILVVPTFARRGARPARARRPRRGLRRPRDALRVAVRGDRRAGGVRRPRPASDFQRELIVEEAVRRARLDVLAESASQPGFVRAAARFVAELGQGGPRSSRPASRRALRDWAGDGPRRAYADEIAAVYRAYRDGLERAGLVDAERFAWGALDALRTAGPEAGGPAGPGAARPCSCTGSTTSTASSSTRSRRSRPPARRT